MLWAVLLVFFASMIGRMDAWLGPEEQTQRHAGQYRRAVLQQLEAAEGGVLRLHDRAYGRMAGAGREGHDGCLQPR